MPRPKKGESRSEIDEKWKKRFYSSMKYQDNNCGQWTENEYLMYGRVGNTPGDFDVALGWGLCQYLISQIYFQNPEAVVHSKAQSGREIAKLLTQVTQYDIEEMRLKPVGNECITDCFTYGYGLSMEDYENQFDGQGHIQKQRYMFRRIPAWDVLFDPAGINIDLSDHKYIFIAYYPTISELEGDTKRYKWLPDDIEDSKLARPASPQKGTYYQSQTGGEEQSASYEEKDPEYKQIRVYECWDKISGKVYDYAADKAKVIGEREWPVNYEREGKSLFPATMMCLTRRNTSFYPVPIMNLIAPQLRAYLSVNQYYITNIKTKWNKWIVPAGLVAKDQVAKVIDTQSMAPQVIELDKDVLSDVLTHTTANPDMAELFAPLPEPEIKRDYIVAFQTLMQQVQEILGFADTSRGGLPKTRSAKEAIAIKEQQNRRLSKMADAVVDFYRDVAEKHIQTLQQTAVEQRYAKITDEFKKIKEFKEYTKDDIQGKFFFDVFIGSSMPKDTESEKQQFLQFMQIFMPALQREGFSIVPVVYEAAEKWHIRNVDDFLKNQKQAAKMVAQILKAIHDKVQIQGKPVPPQALPNAASNLVMAVATKEEIASWAKEIDEAKQAQAAPGVAATATGMQGESNASQMAVAGTSQ